MTIDLIFFAALMGFGLLGYLSGFWMQLMRLIVLIAAYLLAGLVGRPLGAPLAGAFGIPPLLGMVVGTFLAFVVIYLVLSTVGWSILRRRRRVKDEEKASRRRQWDSLAGSGFGMLKVGLILFLLLNAVVLIEKRLEGPLKRSQLGYHNSLVVSAAREHNLLRGLHIPVVGDVQSLSRLGSDPEFRAKAAQDPKIQRVLAHPKIQALINDRSIINASRSRDVAALMANPRINQVLEDPEVRELLSEIDLSEIK